MSESNKDIELVAQKPEIAQGKERKMQSSLIIQENWEDKKKSKKSTKKENL